jgi:hypothetical protein
LRRKGEEALPLALNERTGRDKTGESSTVGEMLSTGVDKNGENDPDPTGESDSTNDNGVGIRLLLQIELADDSIGVGEINPLEVTFVGDCPASARNFLTSSLNFGDSGAFLNTTSDFSDSLFIVEEPLLVSDCSHELLGVSFFRKLCESSIFSGMKYELRKCCYRINDLVAS